MHKIADVVKQRIRSMDYGVPHIVCHTTEHRSWTLWRAFLRNELVEFYEPPSEIGRKTLILDLDETLIHSSKYPPHRSIEFFRSGCEGEEFYVYKRPGVDKFLKFAYDHFDTFIYTHGSKAYAEPVLNVICPFINSAHRLYRDACSAEKSKVKKDLSIVKRKPEDLILVDDSSSASEFNPANTIKIPKWMGAPNDTCLINWLPMILLDCEKAIDVRPVINQVVQRKTSYSDSLAESPLEITIENH